MPVERLNKKKAAKKLTESNDEYVVIQNPSYIFPPFEVVPLAPVPVIPLDDLDAIVMDMDGTTTTTETLCLHSLEYMMRKISGRPDQAEWSGLDREVDYPHIIGNSTTRHIEYLIRQYQDDIKPEHLKNAFLQSAIWFLIHGQDQRRKDEVILNLKTLGFEPLLHSFEEHRQKSDLKALYRLLYNDAQKIRIQKDFAGYDLQVRAAIDIYYQRYHYILNQLANDNATLVCEQIGLPRTENLIEPMPGVAIFLALIKGWLADESEKMLPLLYSDWIKQDKNDKKEKDQHKLIANLSNLGLRFAKYPLKIAVVTSSICYEANIVMTELFRVLRRQIQDWPVSPERKSMLIEKFSDYHHVYDAFVTASDSSEIRLKPHRDLYSIALHQLDLPREVLARTIGFEDSESGTVSIRTAGIGLCIALPFSETKHHDFSAAAKIISGGLPEVLIQYNLFLKK